ncbi:proto-oncogene Mas-like [Paroedura picta]|uniref:proto-oncogene Mas-like n=1 Tax=Paroedura picta TaxID=143630 RepID=UPI0040561DB0
MAGTFHTLHRIKKNETELELWSINKSDFLKEIKSVANIGLPVCTLGLIANAVVCWIICCTMKKSRFIVYVLNMAIGEFIILFHYLVAYLLIFLPSHANIYTQHVQVISLVFGSGTNIYFLTAISAERYFMVSVPLWSESQRGHHLTTIICFSLWTLSILLTMIEYFFCHPRYLATHIIGFLYCHTAIVLQYIVNFLAFVPVMVFCTLGLLIKMQKNPEENFPAALDVSIVATVFLHLMLSAFIKMIVFMNYLVAFMPSSQYRRVSLILDCVDETISPFVYLLVGYWKSEKGFESLPVLIARGLNYESKSNLRTQPDHEQA